MKEAGSKDPASLRIVLAELFDYYFPRAAALEALSGFLVPSPERDDASIFSCDAQSCSSARAFQYALASIPWEMNATTVNGLRHFGQFKRTARAAPLLAISVAPLSVIRHDAKRAWQTKRQDTRV
jgi:hypothetical protein